MPVFFEDGISDLAHRRDAFLAKRGSKLGQAHVLAVEVRTDHVSVLDDDGRGVLDELLQALVVMRVSLDVGRRQSG